MAASTVASSTSRPTNKST